MTQSRGILAYSNSEQEWLIPWWLSHVRNHTSYPICLINCGLGTNMHEWLKSRVTLIDLNTRPTITKREAISPSLHKSWESKYFGNIWTAREGWFLKPSALSASPYDITLYLDLDCEVKDSLDPLFEMCSPFAIVQETKQPEIYNSGVIRYASDSKLLSEWESLAATSNHLFPGDQELLSHLIESKSHPITQLDPIYNAHPDAPYSDKATIVHHIGAGGKRNILARIIEEKLNSN